jgi:hypothetical protein
MLLEIWHSFGLFDHITKEITMKALKTRSILLIALTYSLFSACNSGGDGGGKKDTVVIRDTVTLRPDPAVTHAARRERESEVNAHRRAAPDNGNYSQNSTTPATPVSQPEAPQKKGWSAAAKDGAIGGAAGVAAGALLDKNSRVFGGVLGGLVGGGAGYLIGRARDRKTGRVVKHKPSDTNYNYTSQ